MKTSIMATLVVGFLSAPLVIGAGGNSSVPLQAGPALFVEGVVSDAASGAPLPDVQVFIVGGRLGTLTDALGHYRLELPTLSVGDQIALRAERIGYAGATQTLELSGASTTLNFGLHGQAVSLEEVVVTGTNEPGRAERKLGASIRIRGSAGRESVSLPAAVLGDGRRDAYRGGPPFNTESYAHISENGFLDVEASPLSTFSIDVDRASYANVRRFIQAGSRPPVDAVRIEEMINYFPYDWGEVTGDHPFQVTTEVWQAPWNRSHRLVRVGLRAKSIDTEDLPPSNLVFLLDVSGSMNSPDKLPLLKQAFRLLVEQLRPEDRVAIVVYAGAAGLVLPSTRGSDTDEIMAALDRLQAGGSTAGGQGIKLAYQVARENFLDDGNNRIILATDGDFNVGASSDGEMVKLIEKERKSGTFLTVLGFGTGNLKDSKMEQIADHGNGNFSYVDNLLEARKVLVEEMGGTLLTLAKDVKLQIEFNPTRAQAYRLIGYENRLLADEDFNDDTKDAGELGAGHTVTALYEVVPVGVSVEGRSVDPLRYQPTRSGRSTEMQPASGGEELMFVKVRYKDPRGARSKLLEQGVIDEVSGPTADFRFVTAVAGFGMLLRDSPHAGDLSLDAIIEMASEAKGNDPKGYRGEFIRLVEATRDLGLLRTNTEEENSMWR